MTSAELREIFNAEVLPRINSGELIEAVEGDGPPSRKCGEPPGTRSQIVAYRERGGRKVAVAHRYLRPDETLGASGLPDPKQVLHRGTLYALHPNPPSGRRTRKRRRRRRRRA